MHSVERSSKWSSSCESCFFNFVHFSFSSFSSFSSFFFSRVLKSVFFCLNCFTISFHISREKINFGSRLGSFLFFLFIVVASLLHLCSCLVVLCVGWIRFWVAVHAGCIPPAHMSKENENELTSVHFGNLKPKMRKKQGGPAPRRRMHPNPLWEGRPVASFFFFSFFLVL